MTAVDFDRLVDRWAIAHEVEDIAERQHDLAMRDAEHLAAPMLKLADERRRLVRVWNAPAEARRRPPALLATHWTDTLHEHGVFHIGRLVDRPSPRDLDYRIGRSRAGGDLLELLRLDLDPTVVLRSRSNGWADLLVEWG